MDAPAQSRKRYRLGAIPSIFVWLAIPVVLAALVIGWRAFMGYHDQRTRAAWKNGAIPGLVGLSLTNVDISLEIASLKLSDRLEERRRWTMERVLLMTNGECLFYAYRHGNDKSWVEHPHLFVARDSDGRWFYSSYHFCDHMAMIRGHDPPGSIAKFATRYSAREFDGQSDECLKKTWPVK